MNKSSVLIIVKQLMGFIGAAGVGALISLPAQALNTVPNSLHDVTEQWTSTKSDKVSPESAVQTQTLPENTSAAESMPASETEAGSAPMAPTPDTPDADISATEETPASETGSALDLMGPTSDTADEDISIAEEIPATGTGSASDLMEPEPDMPEAVEIPESSSISSTELQQFANAVTEVQAIERQTQESMVQLITAEGLSPERFNQIFLAQQSAGADPDPEITPEEQQTFDQVFSQLEVIDQASQTSKEQAVMAQGLEMERFSQILSAVRQDPDLQQQVQELLPPAE